MLKQANVYRDTYTNVSVRTGINRQTYYDNQWNLNNRLSSLGLRDNVRSSVVQTMWNSLANTGMNESQMFATAIDNVVTNKIVPYLDTTSQEFNLLNSRLNNDFVKDIRGINKANLEIAGNNYVTESLLNTIIDKVQPMSDEALQNLALGSTEITSFVNTLMSKGYNRDTAVSYATKYFQAQEYGDQMLSSGSTADKLFIADIMTNPNLNLYDLDDATNIMALYGNRVLEFAGNLGGYSSSTNGIVTNKVAHSLGYTYGDFSNAYKLLDEGLTFTDIANNTSLTPAQISAYSNQATNTFASGQNQTVEELQSVTLENFMNELAVIYEKLGLTGPIIVGAIEGLRNILITWLGANLVSKFFGGSGSGLLGKVGSAIKTGAGKVGTAAKTGLSAVGNGSMLAGVGNLASVAGGAYLGYQGFSNMASDISNGEFNFGTGLSTAQGIAGTTAAVAGGTAIGASLLGASGVAAAAGPIGWAALAVAGVAAVGKAMYNASHNYEAAGKIVEQEYISVKQTMDEEYTARENFLYNIRENLKNEKDIETTRQQLIQSGILSEEDMQEAQNLSKDKLVELTDQYIKSTKAFNEVSQEILNEYSVKSQDEANTTTKSIKDWYEQNKNNKNDTNKDIMKSMVYATVEVLKNKETLTDDEQWFLDEYNKNISKGRTGQKDWEWLLDKGSNLSVLFNNVSGQNLENLSVSMKNRGANITTYDYTDPNLVAHYLTEIVQAGSKEEAQEALAAAKQAGLDKDKYHQIGETMEKWGIDSYRQGINNVPADQLAMLHQGEAVLTASTANELRNMTDVYRETTSQTFNLDAIIQNQTSALIIKMDEIIRAITTGVSGTQSLTRNTADAKVWDSMIHMESTKAF